MTGNGIPLEGEPLQVVEDVLQRQEIDARITLSFDRKRGSGVSTTRTFRLVGVLDEDSDEYHLYLTNLAGDDYHASDIAQLYRARWEIELLFTELESRFGSDGINTTDPTSHRKWFQTVAMRIDRFRSFRRGSRPCTRRLLHRLRHNYNRHRPNRASDSATPVEEVLN